MDFLRTQEVLNNYASDLEATLKSGVVVDTGTLRDSISVSFVNDYYQLEVVDYYKYVVEKGTHTSRNYAEIFANALEFEPSSMQSVNSLISDYCSKLEAALVEDLNLGDLYDPK